MVCSAPAKFKPSFKIYFISLTFSLLPNSYKLVEIFFLLIIEKPIFIQNNYFTNFVRTQSNSYLSFSFRKFFDGKL